MQVARGVGRLPACQGWLTADIHPAPAAAVSPANRFVINFRWFHDLSLAIFSESCVYANGRGTDVNIDSHRGGKVPAAGNIVGGAGSIWLLSLLALATARWPSLCAEQLAAGSSCSTAVVAA